MENQEIRNPEPNQNRSSNRGKLVNSLAAVRCEICLSKDLEVPLNVGCLGMKLNHWNIKTNPET